MTSEILVNIYHTTQRNNPEDRNLQFLGCLRLSAFRYSQVAQVKRVFLLKHNNINSKTQLTV
jgi:hypothetical protein